jgi:hypothetical protein
LRSRPKPFAYKNSEITYTVSVCAHKEKIIHEGCYKQIDAIIATFFPF